jgi:hypothetical protein
LTGEAGAPPSTMAKGVSAICNDAAVVVSISGAAPDALAMARTAMAMTVPAASALDRNTGM